MRVRLLLGVFNIVVNQRVISQNYDSQNLIIELSGLHTEVVVNLRGVARVRARGPAGEIEELRKKDVQLTEKVSHLCAPYGTQDPSQLQHIRNKANELENSIATVESRLETLLSGGRTLEELIEERSRQQGIQKSILEGIPEWRKKVPDANSAQQEYERIRETFVAEIEPVEDAWRKAQEAATAASGQLQTHTEQLKQVRKNLASLEDQLVELTTEGEPLEKLDEKKRNLALQYEGAQQTLMNIEEQLSIFDADPAEIVSRLEKQLTSFERQEQEARESEIAERARLEQLSSQGPYTLVGEAERKVAQLQRDVKVETLTADAVSLLYRTVAECRTEAVASVVQPAEESVTQMFRRISGTGFDRVRLNEQFGLSHVVPSTVTDGVGLEQLSGGEQEQLSLIVRLALADVLSREERQLVVLDDVLTASDTGRLVRLLTLLDELSTRMQFIILTCHPERYGSLDSARLFDLVQIKEAAIAESTLGG